MGGERRTARIGDLFELIGGYAFKSGEFIESGIPVIKIKNVKANRMLFEDLSFVSSEYLQTRQDKVVQRGDLLITMTGNRFDGTPDTWVGKVAQFNENRPFFLNQRVGMLRPQKGIELDRRFFSFLLSSHFYQTEFIAIATSSGGQANISPSQILGTPIEFPPLSEQRAIAAILGSLDDKIELNRRMNATLEEMARALFQSWFVDFDPVRAKMDGKQPVGMDEETAALFPAAFQDSELGPIPKGWIASTLGEICRQGGGNIQTGPFGTQLHAADYVNEGIPSIMPADLRDNRIDSGSIARIRAEDAERLNVYRVQSGDVVYSRRGDVERRSLIRKNENGWLCGTGCLRVRFGADGLNPFFGAAYLGTAESRAWVVRHAVGATMPNLNTSILGELPMIIATRDLQTRFAAIVEPWDNLGTTALDQSRTLATLRDTLLPKLLSGEIRVEEAEKALPK